MTWSLHFPILAQISGWDFILKFNSVDSVARFLGIPRMNTHTSMHLRLPGASQNPKPRPFSDQSNLFENIRIKTKKTFLDITGGYTSNFQDRQDHHLLQTDDRYETCMVHDRVDETG